MTQNTLFKSASLNPWSVFFDYSAKNDYFASGAPELSFA